MQFFLMSEGQIGPQEGHTGGPYKWAPDQWARGKGQDHESVRQYVIGVQAPASFY